MAYAELSAADPTEILVETDWTEKNLITQVPGMNHVHKTRWHGPAAWATCVILRGVFGDRLTVGPRLIDWANETRTWVDPAMAYRESLSALVGNGQHPIIPFNKLYPFQQAGALWLGMPDAAILADSMGTGKTLQTLVALSLRPDPLPALIICPNSVKHHWANESHTWFHDAHPYIIDSTATKRRKQLKEAAKDPNALVIINYEAVKLHSRLAPYGSMRFVRCAECGGPDETIKPSRCHKHPKELNYIEWKSVVVDEAHKMKNPQSQQTRACWAVLHQPSIRRRWALTGTPIANHVGDLWSVMHGIAPKDFPTKTKFIDRFALLGFNPYAALDIIGIRPDTREEFDKIIHPRMRRMLKENVLPDLPPKVRMTREAPMTNKQAKAYRQMEEELVAELESGELVISTTNLTKAIRLLQFSSTYTEVLEDQTLKLTEPSPKLDVLEEILEELGERQVAVCALSRQLIELAATRLDKLGVTYRMLTGAVPTAVRATNLQDFQAGKARCMLFTVGAGGIGVSMTAADTMIFLQRSWSMVDNKQAEDRIHRIGSEKHESINIIDIVAPNTIEIRQLQKLKEKEDSLEELVQDNANILRELKWS